MVWCGVVWCGVVWCGWLLRMFVVDWFAEIRAKKNKKACFMPLTGVWRLAQSPDHRTYYYHTGKKCTKWVLTPEERFELVEDLKSYFVNKEGYMHKRAPRDTDTDDKSKSMKRKMLRFLPHQLYKKRYFVLDAYKKVRAFWKT